MDQSMYEKRSVNTNFRKSGFQSTYEKPSVNTNFRKSGFQKMYEKAFSKYYFS